MAHRYDNGAATSSRPGSAVLAWLRLVRVFQKVRRASEARFRDFGLSAAQFDVLAQVGAAEGSSQQQVADALLLTKSNVCQLLDRMERAGLVERQQHGRMNHLYLTDDGQRLRELVLMRRRQLLTDVVADIGPIDAEGQALLRRIGLAFRRYL